MNFKDIIAVVIIIICTLLHFCFCLAETALISISTNRLRHLTRDDEDDHPGAESLRLLLDEPTRIFAAIQLSLTTLGLAAAAVAVTTLARDLMPILRHQQIAHPAIVAIILMVCVIAFLNLTIGEIIPRSIALRNPEQIGRIASIPLKWIELIERPLVTIILLVSNLIVKPFGVTASFHTPVITEEELRTLLEASEREGVIHEDEKEMLHNVISFGDTLVHKVMTPRVHIKALEINQPLEKLINLIVDHGHSRIPVYEESIDQILGIIHAKDLLPSLVTGGRIKNIRELIRSAMFVPEQTRTDELLDQMRRSNVQLAIVQDEYGGTAGLVTIEDLIEEIVGEIQDEYDVEEPRIIHHEDGIAIVDARLPIDDINDELELELPTTDFDTVGGLVFGLFGKPPVVGDTIQTYTDDGDTLVTFTIIKADGRRLQTIKIETKRNLHENEENSPALAGEGRIG